MSEYSETSIPEPLVFAPAHQTAQQLFVLLHDNAADPAQLEQLKKALMKAFPQAVLVLPYGPLRSQEAVHHWFDQAELGEHNYVGRVERALPDLIRYIQKVQTRFELTGEATALAGFGQGATIALEASMAQPDLAGRVLAFSGCYARMPTQAPPATTLHFLHGQNDPIVPNSVMQSVHNQLAGLGGDSTLDIASSVGHELHEALVRQAVHRLQTCVPLRSWQDALSELQSREASNQPASAVPPGTTLH
ncbi:MAG TPA: esterase [Pusillimonas sp.]|jgi:phospholipase/carboxylesterase|nr:esterase [Pusillimonas sp.]MBC43542.1 esterase [Pusillimonas sp.]HBT33596.1 esterase [Pusillimonas sp.]HCN72373.1 esterase [Pusillimonas sp.]|tara:strand:+ start:17486 stop:18229 length:744 start_codon:yes stop_codon:yes gene_type:complete